MSAPDFEALRAARNKRAEEWHQRFAAEHGIPIQELRSSYNPDRCYCACATGGPCEHRWDGDAIEFDGGLGWSATCSRCGASAISHSMRVGP